MFNSEIELLDSYLKDIISKHNYLHTTVNQEDFKTDCTKQDLILIDVVSNTEKNLSFDLKLTFNRLLNSLASLVQCKENEKAFKQLLDNCTDTLERSKQSVSKLNVNNHNDVNNYFEAVSLYIDVFYSQLKFIMDLALTKNSYLKAIQTNYDEWKHLTEKCIKLVKNKEELNLIKETIELTDSYYQKFFNFVNNSKIVDDIMFDFLLDDLEHNLNVLRVTLDEYSETDLWLENLLETLESPYVHISYALNRLKTIYFDLNFKNLNQLEKNIVKVIGKDFISDCSLDLGANDITFKLEPCNDSKDNYYIEITYLNTSGKVLDSVKAKVTLFTNKFGKEFTKVQQVEK